MTERQKRSATRKFVITELLPALGIEFRDGGPKTRKARKKRERKQALARAKEGG